MIDPLVSVLIPTYQRARTIKRAVDSALEQTFLDLEVIVTDNASTDETATIMAAYEQNDRVKFVRHPHNMGAIGNWRSALEVSRGRLIKINWSDDWMDPTVVGDLLRALSDHPDTSFAVVGQTIHTPIGLEHCVGPPGGVITPAAVSAHGAIGATIPVSPGAAMLHRDDVWWALNVGAHELGGDCLDNAVGPDLLMTYGAFRRGGVGVHADTEARVHFEGGDDSITLTMMREGNPLLGRCYQEAWQFLMTQTTDWYRRYMSA